MVVWSNPQLPCDDIIGYEVRLYDPGSGQEVIRSIDSYSTYYVIKGEDKVRVVLERAYTQVSLHIVLAPRYHEYMQVTILTPIRFECCTNSLEQGNGVMKSH